VFCGDLIGGQKMAHAMCFDASVRGGRVVVSLGRVAFLIEFWLYQCSDEYFDQWTSADFLISVTIGRQGVAYDARFMMV